MRPIVILDAPLEFRDLASFVWYVKHMAPHQDTEFWYEFLGQYVSDDNGVYSKVR